MAADLSAAVVADLRVAGVPLVAPMTVRCEWRGMKGLGGVHVGTVLDVSQDGRRIYVAIGGRGPRWQQRDGWIPDLRDRATFLLCCDEAERRDPNGDRFPMLSPVRRLATWLDPHFRARAIQDVARFLAHPLASGAPNA